MGAGHGILLLGSWLALGGSGSAFASRKLGTRSKQARLAFGCVFAAGAHTLLLLLFEITNAATRDWLQLFWKADASLLLFMVVSMLPFFCFREWLLARRWSHGRATAISASLSGLVSLLVLSLPIPGTSTRAVPGGPAKYRAASAASTVGILFTAVFAGSASVNIPCSLLLPLSRLLAFPSSLPWEEVGMSKGVGMWHRRKVTEGEYRQARVKYGNLTDLIARKKRDLCLGKGDQVKSRRREILALERMARHLFCDLAEQREALSCQRRQATFHGFLEAACGYGTASLCALRFLMGIRNLASRSKSGSDPVSTVVHFVVRVCGFTSVDVGVLWQYVALVFIAALVGGNFRTFFASSMAATSWFGMRSSMVCFLAAEVTGLYFLASVVVMRQQLPDEYRSLITDALGGVNLEFRFFYQFYDLAFIMGSASTALWIFAQRRSLADHDDSDKTT